MAPKPIWGAISSYFYPETDEIEGTETSLVPTAENKDNVDEDGWMLVGPKRAPSPDADEVGSVILVNHGCESENEQEIEDQVAVQEKSEQAMKRIKQLNLVEQMLFQHTAAASAERATAPKNAWKARNSTFNKSKQMRVRSCNRNPGRRAC